MSVIDMKSAFDSLQDTLQLSIAPMILIQLRFYNVTTDYRSVRKGKGQSSQMNGPFRQDRLRIIQI